MGVFALALSLFSGLLLGVVSPASATTLQTTLLAPINGNVSSSPSEPHHTPFDGDYAWDFYAGAGTPVYARFRNTNGGLSLTAEGTFEPCASPNQGKGGVGLRVGVYVNGVRLGKIFYLHMTNIPRSSGAIPVGDRIGDISTGVGSSCWGGAHVHVEPRNDSKYSCFFPIGLHSGVGADTRIGIFGGEWATGKNQQCPSNAEYTEPPPAPAWQYQHISQGAFTSDAQTTGVDLLKLRRGRRVWLSLSVRNTGSQTWVNSGANPMRLGTSGPNDRASRFYDPSWTGTNRAAQLREASVPPSGTGTFGFWVKVPPGLGAWDEHFNLVADGVTWLPEVGIYWSLRTVAAPDVGHDFTGDGISDMAVYRPSTSTFYIRRIGAIGYGTKGDQAVPADYTGDGRSDVAVWRPSTGAWWVRGGRAVEFGQPTDRPIPGNYVGDSRADLAVFRPATSTFFVRGVAAVQYGLRGDQAVPADYTGDGKTDIAIWRPSTGTWWVRNVGAVKYGTQGDIPVPADFTGDGKADMAVYRPSTSTYYVRGIGAIPFGASGDRPVPADYTGDAKAELAVWRPSNGTWYVRSVGAVSYGVRGDVPIW